MKNKLRKQISISLIIVGLFLVGFQSGSAYSGSLIKQATERSSWLYVGGGGLGNFSTIQSAINDASNGDIIYVYSGTYSENIVVDKTISIIGENRITTIIEGDGLSETVKITGESTTIQGFTIKNDGSKDGVYTSTKDHTFTDNIFMMASHGIYLYYSSENTITYSLFYDNTHSGIFLAVGQNNTILYNEFYNNADEGIYFSGCGSTKIEKNNIHDNGKGIHAIHAMGNVIKNNLIESNEFGIHFEGQLTIHSNYNIISHNRINDNTNCGIQIEHSQFNLIEFNEIIGNKKGIDFQYTVANAIRNNNITSSTETEIMLTICFGDLITGNNIDNTQQSLVLVQINFGVTNAANNWWGSPQWPQRRIRAIAGWVIALPWKMNPIDISTGPEP